MQVKPVQNAEIRGNVSSFSKLLSRDDGFPHSD